MYVVSRSFGQSLLSKLLLLLRIVRHVTERFLHSDI